MSIEKNSKLIIISSPSGAGKTTLCKLLTKKMKNINLSISYTSRNKRLNEVDGKDYHFINKKKFISLKKKNFFTETAQVFVWHLLVTHPSLKTHKTKWQSLLSNMLFNS